jgi:ATP-dependent protease Clp ATPase subunit
MTDYGCGEDDAARAFIDAQNRAEEAFQTSLNERFGSSPVEEVPTPLVFTPKEIKTHLDKYVIGQEEHKKRLSI